MMRTLAFAILLAASGCNSPPKPPPPRPPTATVTLAGASVRVEWIRAYPKRHARIEDRACTDGTGFLVGFAHDRIQHFYPFQTEADFDVAFLAADGTIVDVQRLERSARSDVTAPAGITSNVEARAALFLARGWLSRHGAGAGDRATFSPEIAAAPPEPLHEVRIGGIAVRVEVSYRNWERYRGLMHRRTMSADEGMIFLYPWERERKFWMGNCRYALDIAYFGPDLRLLNVVSIDPYSDPAVDPGEDAPGGRAPSDGKALHVVEMHKGWFLGKGLVDGKGKPLREAKLELSEAVSKLAEQAE